MKLTVTIRYNHKNRRCVAPFINGFNVWDIPEDEWTPAVEAAIKHAYELGVEQAQREQMNAMQGVKDKLFDFNAKWVGDATYVLLKNCVGSYFGYDLHETREGDFAYLDKRGIVCGRARSVGACKAAIDALRRGE